MTVPDPHPPRRAQEPSHRSLLIANLGFMVVAVVGALAGGVIQDLRWHGSLAKPEGQLDLAERAFQSGNEQVALMLFTKLAGQNNPVAEYWLAHMTELGLGLARDPAKAIGLYQKAAAQNVVPAQQRLGEIYLDGNLVPPDFMQAKNYLEQAAYRGNARAAMLLGQMYRVGLGIEADLKEAYAWSEVATLEGNAFAKRERDMSLRGLSADDQKAAVARAKEILEKIKREETGAKSPTSK